MREECRGEKEKKRGKISNSNSLLSRKLIRMINENQIFHHHKTHHYQKYQIWTTQKKLETDDKKTTTPIINKTAQSSDSYALHIDESNVTKDLTLLRI